MQERSGETQKRDQMLLNVRLYEFEGSRRGQNFTSASTQKLRNERRTCLCAHALRPQRQQAMSQQEVEPKGNDITMMMLFFR